MDVEELKNEKLEEAKLEMYQEIAHNRNMAEDEEYAINHYADEIQEAYDILYKVANELNEYGYTFNPVDLLRMI